MKFTIITFKHAKRDYLPIVRELESLTGVKILSVAHIKEKVFGVSGSELKETEAVEVSVRLNTNGIKSIQNHKKFSYLFSRMSLNGIHKSSNKNI